MFNTEGRYQTNPQLTPVTILNNSSDYPWRGQDTELSAYPTEAHLESSILESPTIPPSSAMPIRS